MADDTTAFDLLQGFYPVGGQSDRKVPATVATGIDQGEMVVDPRTIVIKGCDT